MRLACDGPEGPSQHLRHVVGSPLKGDSRACMQTTQDDMGTFQSLMRRFAVPFNEYPHGPNRTYSERGGKRLVPAGQDQTCMLYPGWDGAGRGWALDSDQNCKTIPSEHTATGKRRGAGGQGARGTALPCLFCQRMGWGVGGVCGTASKATRSK